MFQPRPAALGQLLTQAKGLDPNVPLGLVRTHGDLGVAVDHLTHDSRQVRRGSLFVAYQGVHQDVHRYLPDALARGAAAVLVERSPADLVAAGLLPPDATAVQVTSARAARALIAAALYGNPSQRLALIGITGTDGKTTTSTLTHAMLRAAGVAAGLVTTVAAQIGDASFDTGLHVTTPEAEDVQAILATMAEAGMTAAVLEVTSHGLDQHRVTGVAFDIAAFTNVTPEALEYHGSFDAYREAKGLLFRRIAAADLKAGVAKAAVVNQDDPSWSYFAALAKTKVLTYAVLDRSAATDHAVQGAASVVDERGPIAAIKTPTGGALRSDGRLPASNAKWSDGELPAADFIAQDIRHTPEGLAFVAHTPQGSVAIASPLVGRYNVSNLLAAMAASSALGAGPAAWRAGAAAVTGVAGRMERLALGQDFAAIVDFAHTPNALAVALATARELAAPGSRVVVVFGCAGERDVTKRAAMGRIAGELADRVIVTAEDPRSESLADIMAASAGGLDSAGRAEGRDYWRVPDRGEAIARAVALAKEGDVVIVCGKGHEQSMCFGTTEWPWDDRVALAAAIRGEGQRTLPTS